MSTRRELPPYVDRTFLGIPQGVAAAYENKWGGNLVAYPLDPDPVTADPVYNKLREITRNQETPLDWESGTWHKGRRSWLRSRAGKVAWGIRKAMVARQMGERQYNHLSKTPTWLLRWEFALASLLHERIGRPDLEENLFTKQMNYYDLRHEREKAIGTYRT